ncbi:MAG: copper chaperone PCu(A)C [Pikeienuella sp.]
MKCGLVAMSLALSLISSLFAPAFADASGVVVEQPWARASIGIKRPGAAFFLVRNTGDETVVLVGVETDLAWLPQVHETTTNANGVSSMRKIDRLEIGPGEAYFLEPGGAHLMLMKLRRPMIEGEQFQLTLRFENGDATSTQVPILGVTSRGPNFD